MTAKISKDFPLKPLNTFGIPATAHWFAEFFTEESIREFIRNELHKFERHLILGGGSNLLFINDFEGIVLKDNSKGIVIIKEDSDFVQLKVSAGEEWNDLVDYCVHNGYGGLENLALIPGRVGSSPVQNIGAYGVELKDHFLELEAIDLKTGEIRTFPKAQCRFGYRDSVFKNEYRDTFLILNVSFVLSKKLQLRLDYGQVLEETGKERKEITIADVRDAICRIRRRKLPDPAIIGNAGSFFKNPVVSINTLDSLKSQFPGIIFYRQEDQTVKLAAGWLIEQCGWKGFRRGDAGVHDQQSLVLVNHGNASGREILDLSIEIQDSVENRFGVRLEREVSIIG